MSVNGTDEVNLMAAHLLVTTQTSARCSSIAAEVMSRWRTAARTLPEFLRDLSHSGYYFFCCKRALIAPKWYYCANR